MDQLVLESVLPLEVLKVHHRFSKIFKKHGSLIRLKKIPSGLTCISVSIGPGAGWASSADKIKKNHFVRIDIYF